MEIKRLIIKNFGEIDNLDYKPAEIVNCITKDVANALSYILNNQFVLRHYNSIELRSDTYLFGEMYFYQKGKKIVYTTEIKGFENPVFTKDGKALTDDEVDSDPILTRPYREDNLCVFSAHSENEFLDYEKFVPSHFKKLTEYSQAYKELLDNKYFFCDVVKHMVIKLEKGQRRFYRKIGLNFRQIEDVSESDRHCANYATFLRLIEMIDHHCQYKKRCEVARAPIIVEGILGAVDKGSVKYLVERTRDVARQAFFVERDPSGLDRYVKNLLK